MKQKIKRYCTGCNKWKIIDYFFYDTILDPTEKRQHDICFSCSNKSIARGNE
jgi:hypothetical protein